MTTSEAFDLCREIVSGKSRSYVDDAKKLAEYILEVNPARYAERVKLLEDRHSRAASILEGRDR